MLLAVFAATAETLGVTSTSYLALVLVLIADELALIVVAALTVDTAEAATGAAASKAAAAARTILKFFFVWSFPP